MFLNSLLGNLKISVIRVLIYGTIKAYEAFQSFYIGSYQIIHIFSEAIEFEVIYLNSTKGNFSIR